MSRKEIGVKEEDRGDFIPFRATHHWRHPPHDFLWLRRSILEDLERAKVNDYGSRMIYHLLDLGLPNLLGHHQTTSVP